MGRNTKPLSIFTEILGLIKSLHVWYFPTEALSRLYGTENGFMEKDSSPEHTVRTLKHFADFDINLLQHLNTLGSFVPSAKPFREFREEQIFF